MRSLFLQAIFFVAVGMPAFTGIADNESWSLSLTPGQEEALARIRADSLRGHLWFLASDLLEGRPTPSAGQDVAAYYIAAQFSRAGLEPAGRDGYFQIAPYEAISPNPEGFRCRLTRAGKKYEIPSTQFSMNGLFALEIDEAPVVPVHFDTAGALPDLKGKVAVAAVPQLPEDHMQSRDGLRNGKELAARVAEAGAILLLLWDRQSIKPLHYFSSSMVVLPDAESERATKIPVVRISGEQAYAAMAVIANGDQGGVLSVRVAQPVKRKTGLRNVIGLLRGSDPALQGTYIILSAHYDGTGPSWYAANDAIWNAANDDGSGTASVLEVASALASMQKRPRRSVIFMAFFGEEEGLLGSRYYGDHPVYPLKKTIAAINLEQLGRTDSTVGDQTNRATLTGFDYSDVSQVFLEAGRYYGITVYKDIQNSDNYFARSDNQGFADLGIPAHALSVALDYPDYHGAGDDWDKIDYNNLQKVTRMIALAVLMMAESDQTPHWNASNALAIPYLRAWERRHRE